MCRFLVVLVAMAATVPTWAGSARPNRFEFATGALSGRPAVGIGGGVTYRELGAAELNNRGEVPFFSDAITDPGVDLTNNGTRFAGAPGAVRLVYHAPIPPRGRPLRSVVRIHLFSDCGVVACGDEHREPSVVAASIPYGGEPPLRPPASRRLYPVVWLKFRKKP